MKLASTAERDVCALNARMSPRSRPGSPPRLATPSVAAARAATTPTAMPTRFLPSHRSSLRSGPRCAAREARVERSDCVPLAGNLRSSGCREQAGHCPSRVCLLCELRRPGERAARSPTQPAAVPGEVDSDPRPCSPVLSSGRSSDPGSRRVARRVHRRDPASSGALSGRAESKPVCPVARERLG